MNEMKKMPVLFVGHGSPMNAIEDNEYSRNWAKIAGQLPRPEAILAISAHWTTDGSRILDEAAPSIRTPFSRKALNSRPILKCSPALALMSRLS
jgi:4,5-DOPA dioxygenase extradiol